MFANLPPLDRTLKPEEEAMTRNFREMLERGWDQGKFVCVGLDPTVEKFPPDLNPPASEPCHKTFFELREFCYSIIDATKDIALCYKPNTAFFEQYGAPGIEVLAFICTHIRNTTDVPVILDAKRGDIGDTNKGYVRFAYEVCGADAITLHPYLGREAMQPFLDQKDKGCFILCRTSNPGAGEFQDYPGEPSRVFAKVADNVAKHWNDNGNCGLVAGATYPEELALIRRMAGALPLLIPGIGKQGGDVVQVVKNGRDYRGRGMIINSSSGIIYAFDKKEYEGVHYAEAARRETIKLHDEITRCLKAA